VKDKHSKPEILGATRQILTEVAAWTENLFGPGAAERITGMPPGRDVEVDDCGVTSYVELSQAVMKREWKDPDCAGSIIEKSNTLKLVAKVVDFLNTNSWDGDEDDLWLTYIALFPLLMLLEDNWHTRKGEIHMALQYAVDSALDSNNAEKLYSVLKTFAIRAVLHKEKSELTISELAFISGLAEKTVRMAAVGRNKNPDLVTYKDGSTIYIPIEEARRWMASKSIECPPPNFIKDSALPLVEPETLPELGNFLWRARKAKNISTDTLASELNWTKKKLKAYSEIEDGEVSESLLQFTPSELLALAKKLVPDYPEDLLRMMDKVIHPIQLTIAINRH
jgi:hypothetical protein